MRIQNPLEGMVMGTDFPGVVSRAELPDSVWIRPVCDHPSPREEQRGSIGASKVHPTRHSLTLAMQSRPCTGPHPGRRAQSDQG